MFYFINAREKKHFTKQFLMADLFNVSYLGTILVIQYNIM